MVRAWRIVGAASVLFGYFVLAAPIGYALFALWAALPNPNPRRRARRLQGIMSIAFASMHAILRWLRLIHFNPAEVEGEIPSGPCVLVANHPTLVDISAMIACERNLVFPVKASLFRAFWARPLLKAADQFEASERDLFGIGGVVESAMERLSQGYRVIIFPEGTRSPAGGMHPFGRMAFEIARRQNVPIVPLVITCEPRWLTRENSFLNPPGPLPRMRIRVLEPVDPSVEGSSSRTLRDMISARIRSEAGLT
ncbi:MAG: lysophospholipid acyltransferase family protein [Myxococcota bacterium]